MCCQEREVVRESSSTMIVPQLSRSRRRYLRLSNHLFEQLDGFGVFFAVKRMFAIVLGSWVNVSSTCICHLVVIVMGGTVCKLCVVHTIGRESSVKANSASGYLGFPSSSGS